MIAEDQDATEGPIEKKDKALDYAGQMLSIGVFTRRWPMMKPGRRSKRVCQLVKTNAPRSMLIPSTMSLHYLVNSRRL